jgi:hypothetical protein
MGVAYHRAAEDVKIFMYLWMITMVCLTQNHNLEVEERNACHYSRSRVNEEDSTEDTDVNASWYPRVRQ